MLNANTTRIVCPKCHLPIEPGQISIVHEGKTYHRNCSPAPASAGEKDNLNKHPFDTP